MSQEKPGKPASVETGPLEGELTSTLAFAHRFLQELWAVDGDDRSPAEQDHLHAGFRHLATQLPRLREGFAHTELLPVCVDLANALSGLPRIRFMIHDLVAANATALVEHIKDYPKNTAGVLRLLSEAEGNLERDAKMLRSPDHKRRAGKIVQAVHKAEAEIKLYFSEANPPSEEELADRVVALNSYAALSTINKGDNQWFDEAFARTVVSILMSDSYTSGMTSEKDVNLPLELLQGTLAKRMTHRQLILLCLKSVPTEAKRNELLDSAFRQLGFPPDYYTAGYTKDGSKWSLSACLDQKKAKDGTGPTDRMLDLLESVRAIEKERPGAAPILYEAYGIRFFSRYPTELLIKQYDYRDMDIPYGVLVAGVGDSTNSFFVEGVKDMYEKVERQLGREGYGLRVMEAATVSELERHFRFLRMAYGGGHQASFLVLQAHGHTWNLGLGPDEKDGQLLHRDLEKRNFAQYRDIFVPDFPTVADGCSIGRYDGMAQEWSRVFDSTVYAPKGVTSTLYDLEVERKNGKLAFQPIYAINQDYEIATPHIYVRGRKRKASERE